MSRRLRFSEGRITGLRGGVLGSLSGPTGSSGKLVNGGLISLQLAGPGLVASPSV